MKTTPSKHFRLPVIGRLTTVPLTRGEEPQTHEVLEVDEKPTGTMYLVNAWYKEHKMIPQFIPGVFVARFEVSNSCGICGELPAVAVHAHYRVCQPCLGSLHLHGLDAWSAYVTSEHARGRSVNREEPA